MKYEKPQVVQLGTVESIQGHHGHHHDGHHGHHHG